MFIVVRGKRWKLEFVKKIDANGTRGLCEHPNKPGKRIVLLDSLEGEELIEVLCHEILHAGSWDLSEEAVTEIAAAQARAVQRVLDIRNKE